MNLIMPVTTDINNGSSSRREQKPIEMMVYHHPSHDKTRFLPEASGSGKTTATTAQPWQDSNPSCTESLTSSDHEEDNLDEYPCPNHNRIVATTAVERDHDDDDDVSTDSSDSGWSDDDDDDDISCCNVSCYDTSDFDDFDTDDEDEDDDDAFFEESCHLSVLLGQPEKDSTNSLHSSSLVKSVASLPTEKKKCGFVFSLEMVQKLRLSTSAGNMNHPAPPLPNMIKKKNDVVATKLVIPSVPQQNELEKKIMQQVQQDSSNSNPMTLADRMKNPTVVASSSTRQGIVQDPVVPATIPKPKDYTFQIFAQHHMSVEMKSYQVVRDTFVKGDTTGYTFELMQLVKSGNVTHLRSFVQQQLDSGHPVRLQCCNSFGESIIHTVARHGHFTLLQYLIQERNVSLRVVCDAGRTPLHTLCWNIHPNFDCILCMMQTEPDLLFITDQRGYSPLEYVPVAAHAVWYQFLTDHQELILSLFQTKE
jgi:Ankyrin repeats (many copies)